MSKELIVSSGRHETKVAILEDDVVVELFHEREKEYSLAGSIHKGRVTRVLPGMQSAFVDIGLDRDAFLYVSDFFEDNEEYEAVVSTVEEKVLRMEKGGAAVERPPAAAPVEAAAIALPEAPAAPAATPAGERGERDRGAGAGDRGGGDRGGSDRGGRGRRGRRRRGGRGSSLPESKFFSPRASGPQPSAPAETAETDAAEEAVPRNIAAEPVREIEKAPRSRSFETAADFMVLPGESLAKYSPSDDFSSESAGAATARAHSAHPSGSEPAPARETSFEDALPDEHPLAGLGAISSWVAEEIVAEEKAAAHPSAAAFEHDQDASTLSQGISVSLIEEEEDAGLSAGEVAELELAEDLARAEEVTGESGAALQEQQEEAEQGEVSEEGPEPARIPTSLTATLREQGHRYPHRVSRRMRRKMRGGQPGEQAAQEGPEGAPDEGRDARDAGETKEAKIVAPREDRRPESNPEARHQERRADRLERTERGERPERTERTERSDRSDRPDRERPPMPSISDLLKEGQEIIVQIAKEPLGQKGARITSHIALPGRFVVYMPTVEHVGVSRKIPSDEERQRLKRILQTHRAGVPGGFICRTAAENKSEEELRSDMHFLYNLWLDMRQKAEKSPAPKLLHHDLDLVQRILRDQLTTSFKTIWVDNEELYESILRFVERFQPGLVGRVKLYTRSNPIFDEFGVTAEIEKALRPKVWLKSGGHIVINQTEALVAIDINTGKYVGKSNRLEDTIVKVNTDAIKEIVRQIRLRDLGGIIVVDFIDMDERKNRQKVMVALEDAMRADRAPYKILQFNDFGLVAITRKRVKQSLERTLCSPCPYCEGAGHIKSVATVVTEILQEAQRLHKVLDSEHGNLMLRVNPEVAKVLKSNQNSYLQEIEEVVKKPVMVKSDPLLHQTKFDLA